VGVGEVVVMRRSGPFLSLFALAALPPLLLTQGAASAAGTAGALAPTYQQFYAPAKAKVVEPSLGVDPKGTSAIFSASTSTYKVTFNDKVRPASASFTDISPAATSIETLDPIVSTDKATGRTFVSQLLLGCSIAQYTDDGGKTFHPSEGCGPGAAEDHQTLTAGPLHAASLPALGKEAAYYCAQNGVDSTCSASTDGGVSFGPAVATFNQNPNNKCQALSGHLKVAPDGTVYLPNKSCFGTPTTNQLTDGLFDDGKPSVAVSTDNGLTWTVRAEPIGTSQDEDDNTVDVSRTGRLWMAWQQGRNVSPTVGAPGSAAMAAWSDDQGKTWSRASNLSLPLGLHNTHFATVVTGDPDRAAVSFYGTTAKGDDQQTTFRGAWHYYIATTYNAGRTWATRDVTGSDPVKRDCVDNQGTKPGASNDPPVGSKVCKQRDLYDFMDIGMDRTGRVLGIFTDACSKACRTDAKVGQDGVQGVIARQSSGLTLLATFDPKTTVPSRAGAGHPATAGRGTSTTPTGVAAPTRTLASTGLPIGVGVLSLGLLGGGLLLHRRRSG
jgi:hypothetical protein